MAPQSSEAIMYRDHRRPAAFGVAGVSVHAFTTAKLVVSAPGMIAPPTCSMDTPGRRTASVTRTRRKRMLIASERELLFWSVSRPADGTRAANDGNGDFGTSPFFWAALEQAIACQYLFIWCVERKAQ
jgi:hypothetical protein